MEDRLKTKQKHKKKRQNEGVMSSENAEKESRKKRKKEKLLDVDGCSDIISSSCPVDSTENEIRHHKKKKKKRPNKENREENTELDRCNEDDGIVDMSMKKDRKKKRKRETSEGNEATAVSKKKKKRSHEVLSDSCDRNDADTEVTIELHASLLSSKNKKSKNSSKEKAQDKPSCDEEETTVSFSPKGKKKKKKKRDKLDNNEDKTVNFDEDSKKAVKKKGKKFDDLFSQNNNGNEIESNYEDSLNHTSPSSKRKKKSKKVAKGAAEEIPENEKMSIATEEVKAKKKERKKNQISENTTTSSNEALLSIESQETASNGLTNSACGQWQGEMFDDTARQNKFLRLLGGMKNSLSGPNMNKDPKPKLLFGADVKTGERKKGLFGSLALKTASRDNTALSSTDATNLNRKLEEEYNRALDYKLNSKKGIGLGFTPDPAEGKKFHIDVNKTKSVKFDD